MGYVWQVKGDATFMRYDHSPNADVLNSFSFRDLYILAENLTPENIQFIDRIANHERPPSARNRAEVTENCQHWTLRVIRELVRRNLVSQQRYQGVQQLLEPV